MADNITPLKPHPPSSGAPQRGEPSGGTPSGGSPQPETSYDFALEQGLLGALMVNNAFYDHISDFLKPGHFYDPLHQKIYEVASSMVGENDPATAITLRPFFEQDEQMKKRGGVRYLVSLEGAASTLVNALAWARAIQSFAQRRELMKLGQEIYERATSHSVLNPPQKQIEQAETSLYDIAERGTYEQGLQNFDQPLQSALETATFTHDLSTQGITPGLSTGFNNLDEKLGTLRASDLVILAGRPGMGKTALATNIAYNIARKFKDKNAQDKSKHETVAFFSLEMSAEQLSMRILADRAGVPSYRIQQGNIDDNDLETLRQASHDITQLPLFIDHTGAISIPTLTARARRLKRQKGLGLIVVDYLQLVTSGNSFRGNEYRVQEVSQITQGLKAMAKDLEVPVLALSQLSRQTENRDDKRPQLSDLRDSGSIEQDADIVMFLFREEYYKSKEKPPEEDIEKMEKWEASMEQLKGKAELIVGKHRHGPTGMIELGFDGKLMRFTDHTISFDTTPGA